ncbi:MAG: AraC family transcriptional regulator [Gammaproteobacteria bacterium]|jgi:AraC-like DNA-binding protein|nr:AraC family transcriptional regulator [Gammaproteobacteria bacterium]MBQ0775708.1 AraC family transcriptional regulator [Gammaproteobacteria bacterium]|tara:strand:- start:94711 stop:95751 length:1041 start_codon:yes stop_codon:yes gene_type:complete
MTDLGTISSAALNQYLVSAEAAGLDPQKGLAAVNIAPALLDNPLARIEGERFEDLLCWFIEQSANPLFGLQTSQFVQPGSYSVIGYIAMSATNMLEALSRVTLYEKLVGDMGITETRSFDENNIEIRWLCRHQRQPVRRHLIENILGSWVRYARWLINNDDLNPTQVWLEHSPPADKSQVAEYRKVFGCEVLFNQPYSALIVQHQLLQHRLRQPDPVLFSTLDAHAAQKLSELGLDNGSLSQRVQLRIRALIEKSIPRKEQVAEDLGMAERTLHRRLKDEDTSWQVLLDEVRDDLAQALLRDTALSQSDIAERLGYSDTRSFQRAFKRRCGCPPGEWRQQRPMNSQ